ncbi:glycosyltransferase family A protein [Isoptericola sp. NPDC019482]|uniref:glycosyltransferase family 2 protein n=1 Tax=Isoptericola sp. NPDC019482 TaxID=3154688 RepID=UPI00348399BB
MTAPVSVTVVLPVLDPGPALRHAIDAVVAQTWADWEAIVVDDGSGEDLGWVDRVDPRVRLVRRTHAGVSAARNAGTLAARGRWVAFCDHDDVWAPEKLERQVQGIAASGAALSHTAFVWEQTGPAGVAVHDRRYPAPLTYAGLLRGDHICTSSVLVDRATLVAAGGFDTSMRRAEDLDLWLRLMRSGERFDVVDEPLLTYRSHPSGASSDHLDTYRRRRDVLRSHLRAARLEGRRKDAAAARAGLRRGRELAAVQAFDEARQAAGAQRVRHLAQAAWWRPRVVARAAVRYAVRPAVGLPRADT